MKTPRILCALLLSLLAACSSDPKAASRRYVANGNQYLARGQYREASILYRRALAKDLRSPDAWYSLGLVSARLGELPEARKDFSRAMELDPGNIDAVVQLGDLDLAFYLLDPPSGRGFLADLKEITGRLLKKDSRSFDGLRFSGSIALAQNDTTTAILKFQQANLVKPDQPDLTLTLVQTLFAARRDADAESLAGAALDRQKTFAPLYDALYMHYMRGNRPQLAEQVLQRQIANNPKLGAGLIQLAFHFFVMHRAMDVQSAIERLLASGDRGKAKVAIGELQPLIAKMPRNAALHFNLGRAYVALAGGQYLERAREQFEAALRLDPHHAPAKLAWAELALGRGAAAQAAQATAEILSEDPSNPAARLLRAQALARMAEPEKARAELGALLQMYPTSNDGREQLAELDFAEHRYRDAEAGFRALLQTNDPRGVGGFLKTLIVQGQLEPAVQFANEQVKQQPGRADTRLALAGTLIAAGQYSAAAVQFQTLINQLALHDAKLSDLYLRLGEAKLRGADLPGSLAALQTAKQLAPADARPVFDLALLYDRTGRSEQARKEYESVIQLQPENATALNNLAYLEAEEGVDLDQALAHAQRAQQKLPGDLDVQDTVALVYIRKNLTNDGIRMLRDLVSRRPDSAPFHLHLALALYQKGDRPLAKRELETALRHQPSAKEQTKIRELLAKVG